MTLEEAKAWINEAISCDPVDRGAYDCRLDSDCLFLVHRGVAELLDEVAAAEAVTHVGIAGDALAFSAWEDEYRSRAEEREANFQYEEEA